MFHRPLSGLDRIWLDHEAYRQKGEVYDSKWAVSDFCRLHPDCDVADYGNSLSSDYVRNCPDYSCPGFLPQEKAGEKIYEITWKPD